MTDSSLEVKYKDFLTEDAIKHYSSLKSVSREEAKKMLLKSFAYEEKNVDVREIAMKAIKGIRIMSPKVAGIEQREKDVWHEVKQLKNQVRGLESGLRSVEVELEEQKEIFKKALALLNEQAKPREGLLKCYWKKFKSYPLKK